MARRPIPIKIKPKDLNQIGQLLRGGIQQVRVILRALALQQPARRVTPLTRNRDLVRANFSMTPRV